MGRHKGVPNDELLTLRKENKGLIKANVGLMDELKWVKIEAAEAKKNVVVFAKRVETFQKDRDFWHDKALSYEDTMRKLAADAAQYHQRGVS